MKRSSSLVKGYIILGNNFIYCKHAPKFSVVYIMFRRDVCINDLFCICSRSQFGTVLRWSAHSPIRSCLLSMIEKRAVGVLQLIALIPGIMDNPYVSFDSGTILYGHPFNLFLTHLQELIKNRYRF